MFRKIALLLSAFLTISITPLTAAPVGFGLVTRFAIGALASGLSFKNIELIHVKN